MITRPADELLVSEPRCHLQQAARVQACVDHPHIGYALSDGDLRGGTKDPVRHQAFV